MTPTGVHIRFARDPLDVPEPLATRLRAYVGTRGNLYVTVEAAAFVKWHAGQVTWAEATRDRRIELHSPSWLVRAFPTWNARSMFAHIKPVPRAAASRLPTLR